MPTAPPDWVSLRVEVPREIADAVANFLLEQGSPGVVSEEIDPEHTRLEGSLPAAAESGATAALGRYLGSLAELEPGAARARVAAARVPSVDWTEIYRHHHRP
ncbi:MAG TPA: hypothetical protein VEM57_06425, partial [Candidatus Binatus sp.]|nr:hypothetical protein [Candidatus Binatus sp.]